MCQSEIGKLYFRSENLKSPEKDEEERMDEGEEDEDIEEEDEEDEDTEGQFLVDLEAGGNSVAGGRCGQIEEKQNQQQDEISNAAAELQVARLATKICTEPVPPKSMEIVCWANVHTDIDNKYS